MSEEATIVIKIPATVREGTGRMDIQGVAKQLQNELNDENEGRKEFGAELIFEGLDKILPGHVTCADHNILVETEEGGLSTLIKLRDTGWSLNQARDHNRKLRGLLAEALAADEGQAIPSIGTELRARIVQALKSCI